MGNALDQKPTLNLDAISTTFARQQGWRPDVISIWGLPVGMDTRL